MTKDVLNPVGRDRPEEIEITPQMIEAGAWPLYNSASFDGGTFDAAKSMAEIVIRLALDARLRG